MNNKEEQKRTKSTYVSEIIGESYKSWKIGDTIILKSGTGTGKTTFCKKVLLAYAASRKEKILYVSNRITLEQDVQSEIDAYIKDNPELANTITVTKYQDIESKFKIAPYQAKEELEKYRYIFLDECHYFTSDAPINPYTELTYKFFKNNTKRSIQIYASATAPLFFDFLIKTYNIPENHIYEIPTNHDFVRNTYIYQEEQLLTILENIILTEKDSKIVVFCASGNRIMEIYRTFGERLVNVICSKNYHDKRVKEIRTPNAVKDNTFQKRILLATPVIDNGIDLIDHNIQHIFTEMPTIDAIIQTLGRKRPEKDNDTDYCNYYIREYSEKDIKQFERTTNEQLTLVNLWKNNNEKFRQKYTNDRVILRTSSILYFNSSTERLCINQMALAKYKMNDTQYKEMIDSSFLDVVIKNLPPQLTEKISRINLDDYKDKLLEYLKSIEDKKLFKKEFESVQKHIRLEISRRKTTADVRSVGLNMINAFLDERYGNKYKKRFVSKRDVVRKLPNGEDNPNRFKTYKILE